MFCHYSIFFNHSPLSLYFLRRQVSIGIVIAPITDLMQPHIICIRLTLQKKNMRMLRIHFNQRHSVCEKEVINLRKNAHILKTRTMASINCVILLSHIPFPPIENPPLKYQNTNYWLQKLQKSAKLILFSMFFSMLIIMLILVIYTKNP